MKCIILAGGYAKRMWPLTENQAKCLLPINGRPMIDFIIEKVDKLADVDEIIISTNERFAKDFEKYVSDVKEKYDKPIIIVAEPTMAEGEKLGAVGGMAFVIDTLKLENDLFVINGDNLSGIDLQAFVDHYESGSKDCVLAAIYYEPDIEIVKKMSCVTMDSDNKIIDFIEKPVDPKSNHMSVGFHIFPSNILQTIKDYVKSGENADSPGRFLQWLHKIAPVHGFPFKEYWYDIGSFDIYEKVQEKMKDN